MSRYITVAPNGVSVNISLPYRTVEVADGTIIDNDMIATSFPDIFKKLPEPVTAAPKTVEEKTVVEKSVAVKQDTKKTKKETKKPKKNMFIRG